MGPSTGTKLKMEAFRGRISLHTGNIAHTWITKKNLHGTLMPLALMELNLWLLLKQTCFTVVEGDERGKCFILQWPHGKNKALDAERLIKELLVILCIVKMEHGIVIHINH